LGDQIKARADRNQSGLELQRPAYQSDLKPIPLREPRVPVFQAPSPSFIGQAATPLTTAVEPKIATGNSGSGARAQNNIVSEPENETAPVGAPASLGSPNSQIIPEVNAAGASDAESVVQEQIADLPPMTSLSDLITQIDELTKPIEEVGESSIR